MIRLSRSLRLFWGAYILVVVGLLALTTGPLIEGQLFTIRTGQKLEDVHRDPAMLRFTWVSDKQRSPPSTALEVVMRTNADRFELTLYSDDSTPGEPPCTSVVPWSRSHAVSIGEHRQRFCVEIPRTVAPTEPFELRVVVSYRGLWALWNTPVVFPPLSVRAGAF